MWLDAPGETLFCPGIPGAGKTVLASIVIDHLQRTRGRDAVILYLYCTYDQRQTQTTHGLLSSILRQVLEQQLGPIPSAVESLYRSHGSGNSTHTLKEISDLLVEIIQRQNRAFIVVDALDECSEPTRREFLGEIRQLQARTKLSFMATARPSVEGLFDDSIRVEIRAPPSDIELYLDNHISGLSRHVQGDQALGQIIKQAILKTVDGMYVLASPYQIRSSF